MDGVFTTFDENIKSRFGVTENIEPLIEYLINTGTTSFIKPLLFHQFNDGYIAWKLPGMYQVVNGQIHENRTTYAESETKSGRDYVKTISIYGFNLNIPNNSVINGIEVKLALYSVTAEFEKRYNITNVTISPFPTNDPINQSNNLADFEVIPVFPLSPYNPVYNFIFGSPTNTWGTNLSAKDINSDSFSVNFKLYKSGIYVTNAFIRFAGLVVNVYYTTDNSTYNYERCIWNNGEFNNGEFHSGVIKDSNENIQESGNHKISIWNDGNFNNGKWYGGWLKDGTFNNGEFLNGYFGTESSTPIWNNGSFVNGFWQDGVFNNGEIHNGIIKKIQLKNGKVGD
jgi:hypothetical protein